MDKPAEESTEKASSSYDSFIDLMAHLVEGRTFVPATVFPTLDGTYKFKDGSWWFQKGVGPLFWRYTDQNQWSLDYQAWSDSTPWVKCDSDNPMDISQHPERLSEMTNTMRRINNDFVEFCLLEKDDHSPG